MVKSIVRDTLDFFYPRLCLTCERALQWHEQCICMHCLIQLPYTDDFAERENETEKTFWGRLPFEWAAALFYFKKEGLVQNLVHHIKYSGQTEGAVFAGRKFGQSLKASTLRLPDVIIPVPLHPKKERLRGYNQSSYFALGIGQELNAPVPEGVIRRKVYTGTQTRKSRFERWQNVEHIFELKDRERIAGQCVLLVDDVVTSGATIEACGMRLLEAPDVKLCIGVLGLATF